MNITYQFPDYNITNSSDIFLSYAKEDYNVAKKLHDDLSDNNIAIWFDENEILPGQHWKEEIANAINESTYFLVLLSSNSLTKRGYVQKELKTALDILDEFPISKTFI